jgi:hypothetical protein
MGAQIIQNHMEFLARMECHETVHKIKELDPSLAFEMANVPAVTITSSSRCNRRITMG